MYFNVVFKHLLYVFQFNFVDKPMFVKITGTSLQTFVFIFSIFGAFPTNKFVQSFMTKSIIYEIVVYFTGVASKGSRHKK